jgi:hypothetical protein
MNTYKYFLKEINAKMYIQMSIISMKDVARLAHTPFQELHVIYTSDTETQRLLMEVRFC